MSDAALPALIHATRGTLRAAKAGLDPAQADLTAACGAFARPEASAQAGVIAALPPRDVPVPAHRRDHRPGRPSRPDTDPERRAFVLHRIDRPTHHQIAAEMTLQFPLERRVGKSAIHRCWRKTRPRHTASGIAEGPRSRIADRLPCQSGVKSPGTG